MTDVYKLLINAEKHRVEDIDSAINGLKQEADTINKFIRNTEREWALLEDKLNKDRLITLTALSKSRVLLTKMELQIAESELNKENHQNPIKVQRCESEDQGNKSSTEQKSRKRQTSTKASSRRQRSPNSSRSKYNIRNQNKSKTIKEKSTTTVQANFNPIANENINIKVENPLTQCSVTSTTPTDANRDLTASIIAEIKKTCIQLIDLPKTCIPTNETVLPQKRKIQPVSNVEAYKKPYTQHSLSYGSHVLYNPTADVKRPLNPGDPRTYYYKTDSKVKHPMTLPVPKLDGLAPTPNTRKPGVYIPQCTPVQNTAISTTRTDKPEHSEQKYRPHKYVPLPDTNENQESTYTPVPFTLKQGQNQRNNIVNTSKKLEKQYSYVSSINKKETPIKLEHKNVCSTPQQGNKRIKHICVPTPPLYCKSRQMYFRNQKI